MKPSDVNERVAALIQLEATDLEAACSGVTIGEDIGGD